MHVRHRTPPCSDWSGKACSRNTDSQKTWKYLLMRHILSQFSLWAPRVGTQHESPLFEKYPTWHCTESCYNYGIWMNVKLKIIATWKLLSNTDTRVESSPKAWMLKRRPGETLTTSSLHNRDHDTNIEFKWCLFLKYSPSMQATEQRFRML